jgi:hypothetical protein
MQEVKLSPETIAYIRDMANRPRPNAKPVRVHEVYDRPSDEHIGPAGYGSRSHYIVNGRHGR